MSDLTTMMTIDELWSKAAACYRSALKTDAERSQMERHFPLFVSHDLEGSEFRIGVEQELQVEWFTPLYAKPLADAIRIVGGPSDVVVRFVVSHPAAVPPPAPAAFSVDDVPTPAPVVAPHRRTKTNASALSLDDNYTFEAFVRGPSNSFAYAAATAVAKAPGRTSYNPLFIYGQTGLGKTHLMQAIGHHVLRQLPGTSVCYITSETLLNEYINALTNATLAAFRDRYRKVDVLLLDDVQFIAGKKQMQEEFFNTFNSLLLAHKQIVMTSDVAPRDLPGLESRLLSRFEGGMVTEIEKPSYETRLAILKSKATATNHIIPDEILNFIAENIRSHVRAIEGALRRTVAFIDMNPDVPLTIEAEKRLLRDSIEEEQAIKDLSIDEIQQSVAKFYNVSIKDILSSERTQGLVTPRQVAMFISRKLTTKSLPEIADAFHKNHSTVHHGAQTIQDRLAVEPDLRKAVNEIVASLGRKPSDVLE